MSNSFGPVDPITKEQLEQFGAQIITRFDNQIYQVIQQLLAPVQSSNEGLNGEQRKEVSLEK